MYKSHFNPAFTMAEVLITIGLIGLVAAMTLPTVISDSQKKSTVVQVKKFYNTINNAVQFSIAQNGDVEYWMGEPHNATKEENLEFLKLYILPYIKYNKYDYCVKNENRVCIYMSSGGMFTFRYDGNGGDIVYYVNGKRNRTFRNAFFFQFNKINGKDSDGNEIKRLNRKTSIEPYTFEWDGTYDQLLNHPIFGCRRNNALGYGAFCTKLIQMNNWEIPDEYPW